MSDTAIRVENLGKPYRISQQERYYAHGTLTDTMYALFCSMAFVLNGRRSANSITAVCGQPSAVHVVNRKP